MVSLILLSHGISSELSPAHITLSTRWLNAIDDYDVLKDYQYAAWQEFILRHGTDMEIKSVEWLKGILLLLMEITLHAEVKSDLKSLPVNQWGAITMLRFIIKRMLVRNQEAWDTLEEYIKMFNIHNFPGKKCPHHLSQVEGSQCCAWQQAPFQNSL